MSGIDRDEGCVLHKRREELGLTQEETALKLGMSIHQYQRYEYGESELSNTRMKTGLRMCLSSKKCSKRAPKK